MDTAQVCTLADLDYHSHSIMNINWKKLKKLFMQCYQPFDFST